LVFYEETTMTDGTRFEDSGVAGVLYMAMELSAGTWVLGFSVSGARKPRVRRVSGGDLAAVELEIRLAKEKFGLPAESKVVSCYEAGRDGFWIHRALTTRGVRNHVVESASIEVNRRQRRAKTDNIDVEALLRMLVRFETGDRDVWRTVKVPSEVDEDMRRVHRERERLKKEVTQLRNRIFGLLATQGLKVEPENLKHFLPTARTRDGRELGPALRKELLRTHERLVLVLGQIKEIDEEQMKALSEQSGDERIGKVARLMCLCGIGIQGAWQLVMEFFGWREFRNRREVGALAGLTGTPFNSGGSEREQGISKAGNKRIRRLIVELAWLWTRHQPQSALTRWFTERWGKSGVRSRKVGIVALARKLLVALWHFVDHGVLPDGAKLSPSRGVTRATRELVVGGAHGRSQLNTL
jgi:transposase